MRNAYWAIAKVNGDNPAMKGKVFVAPGPANVANAPTLATVTASSISASCPHPDAAWKFIKFDAGRKWAVERARVANWMPMRNDLADDPAIKADPLLLQFVQIGTNARSYPLPQPDLGRDRRERHRRRGADGRCSSRTRPRRSSRISTCA